MKFQFSGFNFRQATTQLILHSRVKAGILMMAIFLWVSLPAFAQFDSDCRGLKLKAASGIPQVKVHKYSFLGTCKIIFVHSGGSIDVLATVPAEAQGEWDGTKLQFSESFRVLANAHYGGADEGNSHWNGGDISAGKVATVFKCNDDPLITNASCLHTAHSNQSGFPQFSNPALHNRPLLKDKTTLAEAVAMSKHAPSQPGQAAQAPPPKPNVKPQQAVRAAEVMKAIEAQKKAKAQNGNSGGNAQVMRVPGGFKLPPAGLPDLTSASQVRVAGKYQVGWGESITVKASDARRMHNGLCDFAIAHDLLNTGTAGAGAFSRRWLNQQNPVTFTATYPPVPAGGSVSRVDTLGLRPGVNRLILALDNLDQVKESNEKNNLFRLVIEVTGSCSGN
jgi:hypothetical protein